VKEEILNFFNSIVWVLALCNFSVALATEQVLLMEFRSHHSMMNISVTGGDQPSLKIDNEQFKVSVADYNFFTKKVSEFAQSLDSRCEETPISSLSFTLSEVKYLFCEAQAISRFRQLVFQLKATSQKHLTK
jgi:hypothetical protein